MLLQEVGASVCGVGVAVARLGMRIERVGWLVWSGTSDWGLGRRLENLVGLVNGCFEPSHGVAKLLDGGLEVVEGCVVTLEGFCD